MVCIKFPLSNGEEMHLMPNLSDLPWFKLAVAAAFLLGALWQVVRGLLSGVVATSNRRGGIRYWSRNEHPWAFWWTIAVDVVVVVFVLQWLVRFWLGYVR